MFISHFGADTRKSVTVGRNGTGRLTHTHREKRKPREWDDHAMAFLPAVQSTVTTNQCHRPLLSDPGKQPPSQREPVMVRS